MIFVDYSQIVIYNISEVNKMRIKELRIQRNIQQKDLASALEIAANTLSQYETGKREPDQETLMKLADYFNVTTDYLLGRSESQEARAAENEKKPDDIGLEENIIIYCRDGKTIKKKMSKEKMDMLSSMLDALPDDDNPDL